MKKIVVLAGLLAFLVLAGCEPQEPEPVTPEEEVKTPEQIVDLIRQDLAPLAAVMRGGFISEPDKEALIGRLRMHKATYQAEPNGVIALDRITAEVEQVITTVREAERWWMVMHCLDVYEVLSPGAVKYNRLRNMAQLQINKPRVQLKGFFTDGGNDGQVYAFVEIKDPVANQVHSERIREGEVLHGLRFHRIIGNQRGVEFEYLAIPGDFFEVMI